ncbi:MAG: DUF456 domain-containing protein [Endomicrobium sp.]|jgi:uncharacterized protein YqgC (DUF456 family)|nr:DUF456 domain-containing protein [Endomicrobium sp.]
MVTEIVLIVLSVLFLTAGFIGCIVPVLPGPPLAIVALVLFKLSAYGTQISWTAVCIFSAAAVITVILDYIVPAWGAKKFGGTAVGVWGAAIGVIAGIFFLPAGIILGPFLGALAGELIAGKSAKRSLKAAFGTFVGFLFGVGLKIIMCVWVTAYIIWKI